MSVIERPRSASLKEALFAGGGELGELMSTLDWSSTPLGPPERWPQSLRSIVRMMLTSRYQMWLGWGPELAFLYNDAYRPTMGEKHPWGLAKPAAVLWKEIWSDIEPLISEVLRGGEAAYKEGMLLLLERSGFPEETYHTFSYSPLFDDDGKIAGMFCVVMEETERVINDRRLATLRNLASAAGATKTEAELFEVVARVLSGNAHDLPFSLCYLLDPASGNLCRAAATGIGPDHPAAPLQLASGANSWPLNTASNEVHSTLIDDISQRFEQLPHGAWDGPSQQALIVPIAQQGHDKSLAGFFIAGLNPYRRLDLQYQGFVELISGQIGAALANVRAYEEEKKRAESLAQLDRAKTAFFSNVSHEFRTPLTLLLGPIEDLLSSSVDGPTSQRTQLELAHRNGMRLLRLVNTLLDFSRIEAGRVQANYEPTDLSTFSAEIASSFRSAIEKAGLQLIVATTPLPEPVFVDREMWEKILLNLLSNAFKFTFHGAISVVVNPSADGQSVEVSVQDTGIGIPESELPRLFERFHRVTGAQGRSFEGSGIGLALVQELVHLHGGTIRAQSEVARGTRFTIVVPFGSAHLPAQHVHNAQSTAKPTRVQPYVEEALRWLPGTREPTAAAVTGHEVSIESENVGAGKRIVLADDNADMREYVRRLLSVAGYEVHAVENGSRALEMARKIAPDLILTDVMMPVMDGFATLREIRRDQRLAGVPVILLSARAGEEAKIEGLDAGADDYLVKPFASRELIARVNSNIQMAVMRREAARAVMESERRFLMTRERLELALSTARVALYDWDVESDHLSVQGPLAEIFGLPLRDAAEGLPLQSFIAGIHPEDRERTIALVNETVATGKPFEAEYRTLSHGRVCTVLSRGQIQKKESGQRFFSGVLIDLTEEKAAETALREETRALEILNRAAKAIAGNLDLHTVAASIIHAAVEVTRAASGTFIYLHACDNGADVFRCTTAGEAPPFQRDADYALEQVERLFGRIVRESHCASPSVSVEPFLNDAVLCGTAKVASLLAVPVQSHSGAICGGIFLRDSHPDRFDRRSEELIVGLAAQAAVAMDNARLFASAQRELEQRRRAEAELHKMNATLEQRVAQEVVERTKTEEALRQAQKMEAIGQLTGGVAHDFNNLLTVIIGGLDTIRRSSTSDTARIQRATNMALQGAQRAANLTSRLLAFSRRQPLTPKATDLNFLVRDMTDLLHRTIGETIELEGVLAPRLWQVEVDQNQLESAILNLAVNARDAMPNGGKLTIETANTALDAAYAEKDREVVPGQYVLISVSDSGCGMSKEVIERAFEPFFTTKETGRGTGLGLSMVYGFVKQSGGHVAIYSEVDHGTTVKLYFPRFTGNRAEESGKASLPVPRASRGEIVLVVEDNEDVRAYSSMSLKELGYEVVEASDAESALQVAERLSRIDLLFTDVILPGKNGRQLADEMRQRWPKLRVLYTTGYSRNAIVHHGRLDPGVDLINKPFTFDELAARVRDVLDRP